MMKPQEFRVLLVVFPCIVMLFVLGVLIGQQVLYEREAPSHLRPLPRIELSPLVFEPVANVSEGVARGWLVDSRAALGRLDEAGIRHDSLLVLAREADYAFVGENLSEVMKRIDVLNATGGEAEGLSYLLRAVASAVDGRVGVNFSRVISRSQDIVRGSDDALDARDALDLLDVTLKGLDGGLNLTVASQLGADARILFAQERWSEVVPRVNDAFLAAEEAQVGLARSRALGRAARNTVYFFVVDHTVLLIVLVVLLSVVGFFSRNEVLLVSAERRLAEAKADRSSLERMREQVQTEHYVHGVQVSMYDAKRDAMVRRMEGLDVQIPLLRSEVRARHKLSVRRLVPLVKQLFSKV